MTARTTRLAQMIVCGVLAMCALAIPATAQVKYLFKRIPTQFIAALGDPQTTSGSGAETWGLWRRDPGPRGVWLRHFAHLKAAGGFGPGGWQFDANDWWLDENGLIMEKPDFPVPPGRYLVTGEREVTTVLTVHPADANGVRRWELANDAKLFDVTHLPCRSARYTHPAGSKSCTPASAQRSLFPVTPGATMPAVEGCKKKDYAVLLVIGIEVTQKN